MEWTLYLCVSFSCTFYSCCDSRVKKKNVETNYQRRKTKLEREKKDEVHDRNRTGATLFSSRTQYPLDCTCDAYIISIIFETLYILHQITNSAKSNPSSGGNLLKLRGIKDKYKMYVQYKGQLHRCSVGWELPVLLWNKRIYNKAIFANFRPHFLGIYCSYSLVI